MELVVVVIFPFPIFCWLAGFELVGSLISDLGLREKAIEATKFGI